MILAMIPARMGSQRLKQKNLRQLGGLPLIVRAIRKCKVVGVFDSIWVNSEHDSFADIARAEGVSFHRRPESLGNNQATSEHYIGEFLQNHDCKFLVQVHSIAPLLTISEIQGFVSRLQDSNLDCLLATDLIQIECAFQGKPINFSFTEKTNSQDLEPVQRLSWAISAWRRSTYLAALDAGQCATYSGRIGFHPISTLSGHVIKTERDLQIAEALLPLVESHYE